MKKCLLIILCVFLVWCQTVATQSEDGRTLKIKGSGSAKFENGAEIQGGTWLPPLPRIEIDN